MRLSLETTCGQGDAGAELAASLAGDWPQPLTRAGEDVSVSLRILDLMLCPDKLHNINIRLWDGTLWPDDTPCETTVVLTHPGSLRVTFLPASEVGLVEAYMRNDFDVEGRMENIYQIGDALDVSIGKPLMRARMAFNLLRLPRRPVGADELGRGPARLSGRRHSIERDRQAVAYHYNVSNDFYKLWLDERMVYSCGYFHSADDDLDTAQERKLNYICRKLRLQPGQRLLDIGGGWGGLAMYAAQNYGVDATAITLSEAQASWATERIKQAGLADRCRVEVRHYREMDEEASFDALASIEMFEHVGTAMLPTYFKQAMRLLRPGGAFFNQGTARRATNGKRHGQKFIDDYVFPDGELIPINVVMHAAEESGFEVRDVESLREHYTATLRHWVHRLEANRERAREMVSEQTYRVWRMYLAGSAYGFSGGGLNLYQTLLVKADRGNSHLPMTRAEWYKDEPALTQD